MKSSKEAQVCNAVVSVTFVIHEFAASCSEELIDGVLESICGLLMSESREVVLACLGFVRMFVTTVHTQRLPLYLKRLVDALSAMDEEHQRAYRIRTRDIYVRLMRKCGAQLVMQLAPQDDAVLQKRLNNLRKIEARKKKLREQQKARGEAGGGDDEDEDAELDAALATRPKTMDHVLADSDDEDDDLDERDERDSRKRGASKAWIQESDDIVDFLDPAAASKVSATNPRTAGAAAASQAKRKKEAPFKTAADGRLIIKDDSDSSDSASDEGALSQALDNLDVGQKRKATPAADDDDDDRMEPAFKYRAGGSGIHRPVEAHKKPASAVQKLTSKIKAQRDKARQDSKPADYGSEYRSSKARGDVKRQGKPDPFAYVPLTKSVLNKRKTAKLKGQFNGLVKAARKGASAGAKSHSKSTRSRAS